MIVVPIPIQPLGSLHPDERQRLPVSMAAGAGGESIIISRFGDKVWDFWPYIPHENRAAANKKVNWGLTLNDGTRLTDSCHARLLESAKQFLWSLYVQPIEGNKRPSMTSLIHRYFEMVPLLRWMVAMGMDKFCMLEGHTLTYVPFARAGVRVETLTDSMTGRRLAVLEALYHQRSKIDDALSVHPWPGESSISLAGVRNDRKPKTDLIPESVVIPLARAAIDYVLVKSIKLFHARTLLHEAAAAVVHRHQVHAKIARTNAARALGFDGQDDVTSELVRLRTACYIVIDLFSGIRDSEMMSLADCCVIPGTSRDGVEVLWLHGTLYKTGLQKKRWLVPPLVQTAITVLTQLTRPLRDKLNEELVSCPADT